MKKYLFPLLLVLVIGCNKQQTKPQANTEQTLNSNYKNNVSLLISVEKKDGTTVPNFSWSDSTGKKISFSEATKGKPVLLNFWATWCGPCRKEIPDLIALSDEYKTKGAIVIGISADRGSDALQVVSDFTKEFSLTYPIIIDNGDLEEAFGGLRGYPTTFYIGKNGQVVKKLVGLQSKEIFVKEFNAIL